MPNTRTNAPRGALAFDTRTLGRQAGSARTQQLTVPAPDDLRLELARVPVGADLHLDVRFEAVTEGVLVTGTATAPVAGECARCLAPLTTTVTASFTELYLYQPDKHDRHDKHNRHDKHASRPVGRERRAGRRAVLPRRRPARPGAGPAGRGGARTADVTAVPGGLPGAVRRVRRAAGRRGPGHRHDDAPDPRWAGLKQFGDQAVTQQGQARRRHRPTGGLTWRFPSGECPAATPDHDARTGRPPHRRW